GDAAQAKARPGAGNHYRQVHRKSEEMLRSASSDHSSVSISPASGLLLLRACECGQDGVNRCEKCKEKKLLRRSSEARFPSAVPPVVHQVLSTPGRALDRGTRGFMEQRLGHDFSQVRLHDDAGAAESARAVGAQAYTVGQDIVF